ncbi:hypothetical protein EMIHUDRAFT_116743 [Emiliania huxleyi CCMP1516]|uniref:Uncharacterized protein n=2 Tax=Emiliania huxleyi TaxID=2903 RepID=A0A0D3JG31_EMIH1|nr:hypothetical protein EMIHUDRAFT_116743 [Emiliania huxleyi CCMP1516]EOD22466.1 hypothetical protein EMIHUDRAFT_116743 [Emiliania huxleyi CCMP1516]|eukprot:XP_005774895.1 hypothetical protein EMIHUDRAFT_116743 [Emiliania huxleyi CCMP1516]
MLTAVDDLAGFAIYCCFFLYCIPWLLQRRLPGALTLYMSNVDIIANVLCSSESTRAGLFGRLYLSSPDDLFTSFSFSFISWISLVGSRPSPDTRCFVSAASIALAASVGISHGVSTVASRRDPHTALKVAAFMMAVTFMLPSVLLPNLLKDGGLAEPLLPPGDEARRLAAKIAVGAATGAALVGFESLVLFHPHGFGLRPHPCSGGDGEGASRQLGEEFLPFASPEKSALMESASDGSVRADAPDALVRWETEQLEQYTGAASYLRREDCVLGVIESFYIVQTGARVSVIDECKRSCITETDVARLFNAVGRRVATGVPGEDTFPMGGYFNEFRREGVSVELVRELRTVVTGAIAAIGGDVSAITASANSFRKWYSDAQNATAVALLGRGGAVNIAIMRAAKQVFARWYCPGGRLYVPGAMSELASPAAFGDFEVPGGW